MLSPRNKTLVSKIIPFGITWFFFGLVYVSLERGILGESAVYPSTLNPYDFINSLIMVPMGSLFIGSLMGTIEVTFFDKLFSKKTFGEKIFYKTCIYLIVLFLFLVSLAAITNSITMYLPVYHPEVWQTVFIFIGNYAFLSVIFYAVTIIGISLFMAEVSGNLGPNVLKNFFIGKYHQPQEEERIFMFLDMKSSTTIAEKLGHVAYFKLLNKYYADLTEAIIETSGEIYQYVGDEIVISWTMKKGLINNNCIRCFFLIKSIFSIVDEEYKKTFGLTPGFRAGLHCGEVTTGEIGVAKKEILFTGDVLNTTSRIQASCKEYQSDVLISEELLLKLDLSDYEAKGIGECQLRGKVSKIRLFTIKPKTA